jgi:purine-nucleoside phosphorylase
MIETNDLYESIGLAVDAIRLHSDAVPTIGIIIGTGLGRIAEAIEASAVIDYDDIPGFVASTVESHRGRLIVGTLGGKSVVAMQGRFHFYEGYSMAEITFPVRVMRALGAGTLMVSNACGGMNPLYRRGDIMLMEDHINLIGGNPLIGRNDDRLGPRFPDMSEPYSHALLALAEQAALDLKVKVHRGTYVAVAGPNLETRAEYRFLRTIGADVVGMSTVPEVIVARHAGMDVLGISIITDECFPDRLEAVSIPEIIEAAGRAEPSVTAIMEEVVGRMG